MTTITIVGGGLAGLVAAIECAEAGVAVELFEAHAMLGGRARSTTGEFHANYGPHVIYSDGVLWQWLQQHAPVPVSRAPKAPKALVRRGGKTRRVPPPAGIRAIARLRRIEPPVDRDFRSWAARHVGDDAADMLSNAAGVFTFDHDPGRVSAAFIVERARRALKFPPTVRYVHGGWSMIVDILERRARELGVAITTNAAVDGLPTGPTIVATDLAAARRLLKDDALRWPGTRTALLDVGLRARRGDPFIISDWDEAGWAETFSRADPRLAPLGHSLVQVQIGLRPDESLDSGVARCEALLDAGYRGWREREVWRRRAAIEDKSGALDLPGTTWLDRPAVERGDGVFRAGDMVAAPGLLSEVSVNSAISAAAQAVTLVRGAVRV
jgi:phytoene dehydrogenase-like protein